MSLSLKFTEIVHVRINLADSDQEGGRFIVNEIEQINVCNYLFFFIYVTIKHFICCCSFLTQFSLQIINVTELVIN